MGASQAYKHRTCTGATLSDCPVAQLAPGDDLSPGAIGPGIVRIDLHVCTSPVLGEEKLCDPKLAELPKNSHGSRPSDHTFPSDLFFPSKTPFSAAKLQGVPQDLIFAYEICLPQRDRTQRFQNGI